LNGPIGKAIFFTSSWLLADSIYTSFQYVQSVVFVVSVIVVAIVVVVHLQTNDVHTLSSLQV
jgi:hypothetical protein